MNKRLKSAILFILGICIFILMNSGNTVASVPLDVHALSEYKAEQGLSNLEPQSIILTNEGIKALEEGREKEAIAFFEDAKELSPYLPQPYLYLAKAYFSLNKLTISLTYLLRGLRAFLNNFWWLFYAAGIFLISLLLALSASIIVLLIIFISSKFGLYIHEIVEDRKKIFLLVPSIILVFLGPIFGIFAFMLPFWAYMKKKEKALLYSLFLITALVIFTIPYFSSFLTVSKDTVLRNVVKVNSGLYTGETIDIAKNKQIYEAAFTYAIELKRKGRYKDAIKVYEELLDQRDDVRVYNNIANSYVGLGNYDTAFAYYNKALQSAELASTYYNMSQLFRETLNFSNAERYYREALKIDPKKVALYTAIKGTSMNRFVMDEVLSNKDLWALAFKQASNNSLSRNMVRMFSFMKREGSAFLILLITAAFFLYDRKASSLAYRCKECGRIYCSRCEKKLYREDVCLTCHKTVILRSTLSPRERLEKIIEKQSFITRRKQMLKILTLILPGSGHTYYGWPVYGFFILLSSTFFFFSALMWIYFFPPVSMTQTSALFKWLSVSGLAVVYVAAVVNVFWRVNRKWR